MPERQARGQHQHLLARAWLVLVHPTHRGTTSVLPRYVGGLKARDEPLKDDFLDTIALALELHDRLSPVTAT